MTTSEFVTIVVTIGTPMLVLTVIAFAWDAAARRDSERRRRRASESVAGERVL